MRLRIFLMLVYTVSMNAQYFMKNKDEETITGHWLTQGDLKEERNLLLKVFREQKQSCIAAYQDEFEMIVKQLNEQEGDTYFITAKRDDTVVGFAAFQKMFNPGKILLKQICIHPDMWKKGIGRWLVYSILHKFENLNKIKVRFDDENALARRFFFSIGFVKVEPREGIKDIDNYVRYEFNLKNK